jgi:hypothetical protein
LKHNWNYYWNEDNSTLYIYDGNAIVCEISEVYSKENALMLFEEQINIFEKDEIR